MSESLQQPEFATNYHDGVRHETVADALNDLLGIHSRAGQLPPVSIASAYFNVGGYSLLADRLAEVGPVRLLLGADPEDFEQHLSITPLSVRDSRRREPRLEQAVQAHAGALTQDRDLLGFSREADAEAQRLIDWLTTHRVEVRQLRSAFLHGKAFIVDSPGQRAVLAGSSNFTRAGLAWNRELNLGAYQPSATSRARDWFDEQWAESEPYPLADLYASRFEAFTPDEVFMRMLSELYGDELDRPKQDANELGLTAFQRDGVWRAKRILDRRGGVLVADEVGLGKTYIAGELIREAAIVRRQKVLLIAPATLRDSTWLPFLQQTAIPATVVSFEELVRQADEAGQSGSSLLALDDYAMVVVDEAHHLRNARTLRADIMRQVLGGPVPKQVVLLTATPVNNSLMDLKTLISYVTPSDAAFADVEVPSLAEYFGRAMALNPDELSPRHLFDVLDAIGVRRTRRFIRRHYPNERVNGEPIVFPQPVVHRVSYDLGAVLPGFFDEFDTALGATADDDDGVVLGDEGDVLTMARYVPSRFRLGHETQQFEIQNAGLLRSALLKRFESSGPAFTGTVATMIASHEEFLRALDAGHVLTGDALRAWIASDSDDIDALVGTLDDEVRGKAETASDYDVATLRAAVEADRDLLSRLGATVRSVTAAVDPKVAALADALATIAAEARQQDDARVDARDRRKVVVFTYFADTAAYLEEAITHLVEQDPRLADYRGRIVRVTGSDVRERKDAIVGFAPRTAGTAQDEDLYDLAIATDVLSEGVNLQQACHIINYDLPWNPMRLVQRHGRVDRIGSKHARIHLRCFFPDQLLDRLLKLEERLQRKVKQAAAAFGVPDSVLPGIEAQERVLAETREEIERLNREQASLFDDGGSASASSEEYQRRLARFRESSTSRRRVANLPWGAGTAMVKAGVRPGVVFCARIADHHRPAFRFVAFDPASHEVATVDGGPDLSWELLTCLDHADPVDDQAQVDMPDWMRGAALDAWPVAQASIREAWMRRADPALLQPRVPRTMRDAARLVRERGTLLGDDQGRLVRRLNQNLDERLQRRIREVLREGTDTDAVVRLKVVADELRLTEPDVVRPLPEIKVEDVRLICWTGIHPG